MLSRGIRGINLSRYAPSKQLSCFSSINQRRLGKKKAGTAVEEFKKPSKKQCVQRKIEAKVDKREAGKKESQISARCCSRGLAKLEGLRQTLREKQTRDFSAFSFSFSQQQLHSPAFSLRIKLSALKESEIEQEERRTAKCFKSIIVLFSFFFVYQAVFCRFFSSAIAFSSLWSSRFSSWCFGRWRISWSFISVSRLEEICNTVMGSKKRIIVWMRAIAFWFRFDPSAIERSQRSSAFTAFLLLLKQNH